MIKGTSIKTLNVETMVEGKPKNIRVDQEYERIYLDVPSGYPTETYGKQADKSPLQIDGKEWQGVRPKDLKMPEFLLSQDFERLIPEALAYHMEKQPVPAEWLKEKDPETVAIIKERYAFWMIVHGDDYGADLWVRNALDKEIKAKYSIVKPITEDDARVKLRKTLTQAGKKEEEIQAILDMAFPVAA